MSAAVPKKVARSSRKRVAAKKIASKLVRSPLIHFRLYQMDVATDHATKTLILHWSRQIGKSFILANWAIMRLVLFPGRLVTVLSNSKDNGAEFAIKCREVCEKLYEAAQIDAYEFEDLSPDPKGLSADEVYEAMNYEVRVRVKGKWGRIKVLAANPRTARGFSGDLVLDEFAFHEDGAAIWEAAEPIISANPDYLCRISSTGNGRRNMFYQLISEGRMKYHKMPRSEAHRLGLKIFSAVTGREITPAQAREEASDKAAYDQNYECAFRDENSALLTANLVNQAKREGIPVENDHWSATTLAELHRRGGDLYVGVDVGRTRDLTVMWVLSQRGPALATAAVLRIRNMRLPDQQRELDKLVDLRGFRAAALDMTGLGLGLTEYAQDAHGWSRIEGVNFGTTEALDPQRAARDGDRRETARVTEIMATNLVQAFEDRRVTIPTNPEIADDLRRPEKIVTPGGKVSIAAARSPEDHADHFWALALAQRAAEGGSGPLTFASVSAADLQHRSDRDHAASAWRTQPGPLP